MPIFSRAHLFALALGLSVASNSWAEASPVGLIPPFPTAFSATSEHATAQGCVWRRFTAPASGRAQVGDRAWALVTAAEGDRRKQWLVDLEVGTPTADEQKKIKNPPPFIMYVNTGSRIEFQNDYLLLELRTSGPFLAGKNETKRNRPRSARAAVNGDHLMLGFDRACAAMLRLKALRPDQSDQRGLGLSFSTQPFPPEETAKNKELAEKIGLTSEDEKAFAGTAPALLSFFQIALTTPGLQDIFKEVLDLPLWSIISRGGKIEPDFKLEGEHMVEVPSDSGDRRFLLPMMLRLNGKPALHVTMIVTTPRPPLLTTAGIVAVYARHPTDPKKTATIEIVSAERPSTAAAKP